MIDEGANRTYQNHEDRIKFLEDQRKITVARLKELQDGTNDWPLAFTISVLAITLGVIFVFGIWRLS